MVSDAIYRPRVGAANQKVKRSIIVIPFVPQISNRVRAYLAQEDFDVFYTYPNKVGDVLYSKHFGPDADPKDKFDRRNVVYRIDCEDCDSCYIGRTERSLGVRFKEHVSSLRKTEAATGLTEHIWSSGHSFNRDTVRVIDSAKHKSILATKESIHIKSQAGRVMNNQSDLEYYSRHISNGWNSLLKFV